MKIHVVEVRDPLAVALKKKPELTLAQFEDSERAQKFIWWAARNKYQVRYFTSTVSIVLTPEEKSMLDKILDEWNKDLVSGDSTDAY